MERHKWKIFYLLIYLNLEMYLRWENGLQFYFRMKGLCLAQGMPGLVEAYFVNHGF